MPVRRRPRCGDFVPITRNGVAHSSPLRQRSESKAHRRKHSRQCRRYSAQCGCRRVSPLSSGGGGDVRALTWAHLGVEAMLELLAKRARVLLTRQSKRAVTARSKTFLAGRFAGGEYYTPERCHTQRFPHAKTGAGRAIWRRSRPWLLW